MKIKHTPPTYSEWLRKKSTGFPETPLDVYIQDFLDRGLPSCCLQSRPADARIPGRDVWSRDPKFMRSWSRGCRNACLWAHPYTASIYQHQHAVVRSVYRKCAACSPSTAHPYKHAQSCTSGDFHTTWCNYIWYPIAKKEIIEYVYNYIGWFTAFFCKFACFIDECKRRQMQFCLAIQQGSNSCTGTSFRFYCIISKNSTGWIGFFKALPPFMGNKWLVLCKRRYCQTFRWILRVLLMFFISEYVWVRYFMARWHWLPWNCNIY